MTVERTVCRYSITIGTGEFCGHPETTNNHPCDRNECNRYTPLMYKPEEPSP